MPNDMFAADTLTSPPTFSPKATSRRFSPTRLATTLTSSSPPLPTSTGAGNGSQAQGFIVLETNYRLYAYTGESVPSFPIAALKRVMCPQTTHSRSLC